RHGGDGRADTDHAFLAHQAGSGEHGFLVAYLKDFVDNRQVQGGGQEIFADAFGLIGLGVRFGGHTTQLVDFVQDGAHRVDPDDADFGVFFLEIAANAGDGAAGAHANDY